MTDSLKQITREVVSCTKCPRLVDWRQIAALDPPARYRGQDYWSKPLPGFGDAAARVLVVGLAPAAHGGNRTGRIFTGDRSGEWLFRALHRAGFANQPTSTDKRDGLVLTDCYIAAAVRCAPPANKPTTVERDNCLTFMAREIKVLSQVEVMVALGSFAWDAVLRVLALNGVEIPKPRPKFGHGRSARVGEFTLIGSYHPSQQNTFTGKLTEKALDEVFDEVKTILKRGS